MTYKLFYGKNKTCSGQTVNLKW